MTISYFKFEKIPFEQLKNHGAKKLRNDRFDCTQSFIPDGEKNPLDKFENKSGRITLSFVSTYKRIKCSEKRMAEHCLLGTSTNLSSLYRVNELPIFWGNDREKKNGYLFRTESDTLHLYVIHDQCFSIKSYYTNLCQGKESLCSELKRIEGSAEQFYDYSAA